jgi:hypothetical protein
MELHMTNIEMIDIHDRIKRFFELDKLFTDCIPSLAELYMMLNNPEQMTQLTKHVMGLYLKKVDADYLESIMSLGEKEFPIHITKEALETEIDALRNINQYKPNKEFFEKQLIAKNANSIGAQIRQIEELQKDESFKTLKTDALKDEKKIVDELVLVNKAKIVTQVSLANPSISKLAGLSSNATAIMKSDIMYEDFAYVDKIFRDDEVRSQPFTSIAIRTPFSIGFLSGLDERLFSGRSPVVDLVLDIKPCPTKSAEEVVTKSEDEFLAKARTAKVVAPNPRLNQIKETELAKIAARSAETGERKRVRLVSQDRNATVAPQAPAEESEAEEAEEAL